MSLRDWQKNSWLVEHKSSPEEIAALFAIIERDLASAKVAGLGDDWRLSIGYNGALQAATVALAASGFRAAREQHHYRTIQSLALTIGWPAAKVDRFDRFRKKRNMIGYETAGVVSEQEWHRLDIPDTFDSVEDDIGGVEWNAGDLPRSSSVRQ